MKTHEYFVYIISNTTKSVYYTGMTNDLVIRLEDHYDGKGSKFTQKYNVKYLLYYERFDYVIDAIHREKQLKKYKREWKDNLIKEFNPKGLFLNSLFMAGRFKDYDNKVLKEIEDYYFNI